MTKQNTPVETRIATFHGNCSKRKLSDLAELLHTYQNKPDVPDDATVSIDVEFEKWESDCVDVVNLTLHYERLETDDEYRRRLAKERRERATSAAFAERKKARDIIKLKEEARRLGFVLALPSEQ